MLLTWILRTTVGTRVVSRNRLDQFLERPLVARLLALVQGRCHLLRMNAPSATRGIEIGSERQNVHEGKHVGFETGRSTPENVGPVIAGRVTP